MPPLRLDSDLAARVQESTVDTYRRDARAFADWLVGNRLQPVTAEERDDLLVEWKNDAKVGKSKFGSVVAAVEFFFLQI